MMVKGFIFFRDGKIPFVIENYRMELFTDDSLLDDFCKEYNFKENYILHGQCFDIGIRGRKATFLVENSLVEYIDPFTGEPVKKLSICSTKMKSMTP